MFSIACRIPEGQYESLKQPHAAADHLFISGYFLVSGEYGKYGYIPDGEITADESGWFVISDILESLGKVFAALQKGRYAAFIDIDTISTYIQFELIGNMVEVSEISIDDKSSFFLHEKLEQSRLVQKIALVSLDELLDEIKRFSLNLLANILEVNPEYSQARLFKEFDKILN
ncbi:hypothetical protein SAMN02745857_01063 [Andreprevotia lacus DSM 23236]|jgi:hypothetical protein|uniref:Uncharacterized protein n=1 Tax=Andreprevotia lacus DSM 23236 TaxID=1121001 RepID=A0A1W1XAG3_9NEIS|nr:hypothetical protein [Andreprevotia lacus]SMC20873.1 hypothetical protein SAMN02745857_01063 [Andreprevotia lacus DSM 23236]